MERKTLHISTSPHLVKGVSTVDIMRNVVYALLPVAAFSIYAFGLNALLVIATAVIACVLTEHVLCRWSTKDSTIGDWSAVITGLLFGLTLPPSFPLWMVFIGGVVSIALGKFVFGGLGYNVFNPALVGRAFLQAAFPVAITTWSEPFASDRFGSVASSVLALPFMEPVVDAVSGATPLSAWKFDKVVAETQDLMLGLVSGSAGETSTLVILIGGLYLIIRKMMNWRIPVAILTTVYLLSAIMHFSHPESYPSPQFMLFSGGLMLGAVFMATDMVGSPITSLGVVIYGIMIGLLVVVIRLLGGLPEGVMYAILIGNALAPQIDKVIQPRVYGTKKISS
ncbi:RnfABCDGE type electron transport complex subunit D [Reichenbachiella ulvae]|uniref:Ion-translocating oxidoreductase complex subunit D n=1 Tax=Reichenbachiella ulvae TaxID=2980104 RepID=A0ABT3CUQ2_9BACT|nr:RnfABCDGE type electron transport complex subunit D [Reichenbachiella ulvae]MCV9387289.1 RnfABCDGE type electron transport complex subunit D [Reichenbachiella ulvae]